MQNKNVRYAYDEPCKNVTKLNLDGRGIYDMDISLLNRFPNLHDLSLKEHEVATEPQRIIFKQIL